MSKSKDKEVQDFLKIKYDEAIQSLVDDANKKIEHLFEGPFDGLDSILGKPIKRKWWKFWAPKYTYPDLESDIKLNVDVGKSMPVRSGQVVRVKSAPVYDPDYKAKGGHVTRTMPRQLKKLKEAQEARTE